MPNKTSAIRLLSFASQVIVIAVGLVVILIVGRAYFPQSTLPRELRVGATIPLAADVAQAVHKPVLIVFMRDGCHFCEESLPFYVRLEHSKSIAAHAVTFIAVFPDPLDRAEEMLRNANLNIPVRSGATLSSYGVRGTPTLVLTDSNGRIAHTWLGKLDASGEQSVMTALQRQA